MVTKNKCLLFGCVVIAATASTFARAQAPSACELHFWPTEFAQTSNYSGVGGAAGSLLDGKRMIEPTGLLADLPWSSQIEALSALDLQSLLGTSGPVKVILESTPVTQKDAASAKARLTASNNPCYAELFVKRMGYRSHITAGRDFGAVFILRRYSVDPGTPKITQGAADVSVKLYPAKTEAERPAANAELKQKFGEVAKKFLLKQL